MSKVDQAPTRSGQADGSRAEATVIWSPRAARFAFVAGAAMPTFSQAIAAPLTHTIELHGQGICRPKAVPRLRAADECFFDRHASQTAEER